MSILGTALIAGTVGGVIATEFVSLQFQKTGGIISRSSSNSPVLTSEDQQTIQAVKRVSPAVVSIVISKVPTAQTLDINAVPFNDLFGDNGSVNVVPQKKTNTGTTTTLEKVEVGGGTGFIVSSDGLIVTNRHVVEDTEADYTVLFPDGTRLPAKVVDRDVLADVAILRVDKKDLPTVHFGDSSSIAIGQTVIAIGNALSEFHNTVTKGIISGTNRHVTAGDGLSNDEVIEEAIQTDAAINLGNSGGPLVDLEGNVIGMNTAVTQPAQNIGFAIPSNLVRKIAESVEKFGHIVRPRLGVQYQLIDVAFAKEKKLSVDHGALVVRGATKADVAVIADSPAAKAGIEENDIILSIDGEQVDLDHSLGSLVYKHAPGDIITVVVNRADEEKTFQVTLDEWKAKN